MKKAIVTVKYPILDSDSFIVKTYDDGDLVIVIEAKVECVIATAQANSRENEALTPIPPEVTNMFIPVSNITSIMFSKV